MKLDHSERIFARLQELFELTPCPPSKFETFQMVGLDFEAQGYESEKLGHVSVQTASGMGGAMQMESLIVNPFSVDGPLFSLDLISAQGKYTLMMELYDTLLTTPRDEAPFETIKARYAHIMDIPHKPNWYDDIQYKASCAKLATPEQAEDLSELIMTYAQRYMELLQDAAPCDVAQKRVKADAYRDGLLSHGGPATDAFLKFWGPEKTGKLFKEVLFG